MRFILCFHSIVRRLISSGRLNRCVHINKSMHEYLLMRAREREDFNRSNKSLSLVVLQFLFFSLEQDRHIDFPFYSLFHCHSSRHSSGRTNSGEREKKERSSLSLSFPAVFSSPSSSCWQFFHTALTVTARVHGSARSFLLFVCVCFSLSLSLFYRHPHCSPTFTLIFNCVNL